MRGKFCWSCTLFLLWIPTNDKIFNLFRTLSKFWWMPSSTVAPVRTPLVLVVLVPSGVRLWTSLHWGVSTRPSGSCVPGHVKPPSGISRLLLSVWLMSWSMLPRYSDLFLAHLSLMCKWLFWLKNFGCCLEYDLFWFSLIPIKFGIKFVSINRACL